MVGADVRLPELAITAVTDENGEVEVPGLPAGSWLVLVSTYGYSSAQSFIEFTDGAVAEGDVALTEGPVFLEGLTITAEMRSRSLEDRGFYNRERQGFGYHYDPLEIEEMIARVPSDLLRMIPGNVPPRSDGGPRNASGISGALGSGTSLPAVYVEGVFWSGDTDDLNVG